jgi:hypothetical protein
MWRGLHTRQDKERVGLWSLKIPISDYPLKLITIGFEMEKEWRKETTSKKREHI